MMALYFFLSFLLSFFLSAILRFLMRKWGIVDKAKVEERKIHKKNTPYGGGWAIYCSVGITVFLAAFIFHDIGKSISSSQFLGIALGGLILMIGGTIDDWKQLSPSRQIITPVIATLIVLAFGIGLTSVNGFTSHPIHLDQIRFSIDGFGQIFLFADMLVFVWLMGMMYTTKLLDGLDGLVTGIVSIGCLVVFFLTRSAGPLPQPEVALMSLIFLASCLGFLVWNWHPAKLFLGEGGSLLLGFLLGILAIISGSKIATTLLVVGIPMLDMLRVLIRRKQKGKPLFQGDREHLHFRLIESGFNQKETVLLFYAIALLFGMSTLFLQGRDKMIALILLLILMILTGMWFSRKEHDDMKT